MFYGTEDGPMSTTQVRRALSLCHECEVRLNCLEEALTKPERHGVWGGMTPRGRKDLMKAARGSVNRALSHMASVMGK